ncbi:hypothetical protein HDV00_009817, partial [Rhizophlyctis rosea]
MPTNSESAPLLSTSPRRVSNSILNSRRTSDVPPPYRRPSGPLPPEDDTVVPGVHQTPSGVDHYHRYDHTDKPADETADEVLSLAVMKREGGILAGLAWPVTLGYVLQMSLSLASVFSVGHLGTKELASAALANMFCNVTGYSLGIRAIVVMFFMCFPISLIWWFADGILLALGQHAEIADLSAKFARCALIGLFPYLVNECLKRYLQCQGIMKANMLVILIASPINIFLQWLLVWSPINIGVLGAPIATGITFNLLPLLTWIYIKFINGGQAWGGWDWKEALDRKQIWEFLKLGIPGVGLTCSEWWAFEIIALAAGLLGDKALATQTVVLNTASLTYMLPLGISTASSTRIGNALGASLPRLSRSISIVALGLGLLVATFNSSSLIAVRNHWGRLWTDDPEVISLIAQTLPLCAIFQLSDAIGGVGGGILRGCGRQEIGAYINLAGYYLLGIPVGLWACFKKFGGPGLGIVGLWIGLTVGL